MTSSQPLRGEEPGLRPGGEPRTVDNHQDTAIADRPVLPARRRQHRGSHVMAVGIGERYVLRAVVESIEKCLGAAGGPVDELIGDHQGAWPQVRVQGSSGHGASTRRTPSSRSPHALAR